MRGTGKPDEQLALLDSFRPSQATGSSRIHLHRRLQLPLHFAVNLVKQHHCGGDQADHGGVNAHHQAQRVLGLGVLWHIGYKAVIGKQPRRDGWTDGPTDLLREGARREEQPRGTLAELPCAIIRRISDHGPKQRHQRRRHQAHQNLVRQDERLVLRMKEIEHEIQDRRDQRQ